MGRRRGIERSGRGIECDSSCLLLGFPQITFFQHPFPFLSHLACYFLPSLKPDSAVVTKLSGALDVVKQLEWLWLSAWRKQATVQSHGSFLFILLFLNSSPWLSGDFSNGHLHHLRSACWLDQLPSPRLNWFLLDNFQTKAELGRFKPAFPKLADTITSEMGKNHCYRSTQAQFWSDSKNHTQIVILTLTFMQQP